MDYAWCWIIAYFCANLGLTLHNKWVLDALHWTRPWLLTAIHIGVSGIGAKVVLMFNTSETSKHSLDWRKHGILVAFSVLYTFNIAMSNISLLWVSLAFHQITRSSVPVVTALMQWMIDGEKCSWHTFVALILVVVGVCLSTVHEVSGLKGATVIGVSLALFGVVLTTTKGIATNKLLVGSLQMNALQLLVKMTIPCVLQCWLFAAYSGELEMAKLRGIPTGTILHLMTNGLFAFVFNYVSFSSNAALGPLALAVAANVKQVVMVILAMMLFDRQRNNMSVVQFLGVAITLIGGAWYSNESRKKKDNIPLLQASTSSSSETIALKV